MNWSPDNFLHLLRACVLNQVTHKSCLHTFHYTIVNECKYLNNITSISWYLWCKKNWQVVNNSDTPTIHFTVFFHMHALWTFTTTFLGGGKGTCNFPSFNLLNHPSIQPPTTNQLGVWCCKVSKQNLTKKNADTILVGYGPKKSQLLRSIKCLNRLIRKLNLKNWIEYHTIFLIKVVFLGMLKFL